MSSFSTEPFDYTSRDFTRIKSDLLRRMRASMPEWDPTDASFEMLLVEMMSYVGDVLNFYVDRMGAEAYLQTAVLRESILNLAQMFGYVPIPQTGAVGTVRFTKVPGLGDVVVPAGTQLYAQKADSTSIIFETLIDHVIEGVYEDIEVAEGSSVRNEQIGTSNGVERQVMTLIQRNVIKDSVHVYTRDGNIDSSTGLPQLVEWTYVYRIVDALPNSRSYTLLLDENGYTLVRFGDGVTGQIPATGVPVVATYRYGVGADGNVSSGAIRSLVSGDTLSSQIATVANSAPMSGGSDAESLESMRRNIPKSLRTLERAVTLEDYGALALGIGGVSKASANATVWSNVIVAVAPNGGGVPNTQLLTGIKNFLETKSMIGTTVTAIAPTYTPVNVTISITVNERARRSVVQDAVLQMVKAFFEFDRVSFGQRVARAPLFKQIVDVEGVDYVAVTAWNTDGAGDDGDFTLLYNQIPIAGNITITATGGIVPI